MDARRHALVCWVVQWEGENGWWVWSAHKYRSVAWRAMRKAREEYATQEHSGRWRTVPYMPEEK